jgi:hypothetical protein
MLATVIADRIGWTRSIRVLRGGTTDQQLDRCARLPIRQPHRRPPPRQRSGRSRSILATGLAIGPAKPATDSSSPPPARVDRLATPATLAAASRALRLSRYPLLVVCRSRGCGAMREASRRQPAGRALSAPNEETSECVAMGRELLLRGRCGLVRRSHFLHTVEDQIEPELELLRVDEAGLGELGCGFGEVGIFAGGEVAEDELGHL